MSDRADSFRSARIALIGCGAAAAIYRTALRRLGIRPTLYVDADLPAARRLAGNAEIAQKAAAAFDRFDAAIVTGIGVGSADELRDLALAAKPILCGPEVLAAATRSGRNRQILRLARGSFAGSHLRFAPDARRMRSLLNSGRLGPMVSFDARLGGPPPRDAASSVYWDAAVAGGGVLIDPGMHVLDLLAWWIGPLTAATLRDDSAGGLEAEAIARVSVAGGLTGIVELSRMRSLRNSVVLTGTNGHVEFDLERMTLHAEPPALVDSLPEPAGDTALRDGIVADMHRRRLEGWLDVSVLRTSPAADELADSNAIEALTDLYATRKRFLHPWERTGPTLSSVASGPTSLAGRSVLVTGGTGFIGARLTERLVELGAKVTVAVRNFRHAARIARLDVKLNAVDLGDPGNIDDVVGHHEVVFSVAYDFKRSGAANVALHRNLADACVRRGVRRFVHLSSIAVYDDWPTGALDERSPKERPGSEYKIAKRDIEVDLAQRAAAGALSCAILQPTIVYGPFSTFWTDQFALQLLAGKIVLPRDGLGHCSGVYVDDLVDALLTAAVRTQANAETWIISGSRSFDWAALLGGYAEALGKKIEYDDSPQAAAARSILSSIRRDPARIMHWAPVRRILGLLSARLGEERVDRLRTYVVAMRRRHGPAVLRPSDVEPLLYLSKGSCSIEKARQELNFAPAFDLEEGLKRTQDYLQWRYQGTRVDALEP